MLHQLIGDTFHALIVLYFYLFIFHHETYNIVCWMLHQLMGITFHASIMLSFYNFIFHHEKYTGIAYLIFMW